MDAAEETVVVEGGEVTADRDLADGEFVGEFGDADKASPRHELGHPLPTENCGDRIFSPRGSFRQSHGHIFIYFHLVVNAASRI
ncbi:hypothetical protein GCM10008097_19390 [Mycetocola manganoxydans]|nr:hypothetical protein GCM10008097_19390 [Mycetocola manganoxydans]